METRKYVEPQPSLGKIPCKLWAVLSRTQLKQLSQKG